MPFWNEKTIHVNTCLANIWQSWKLSLDRILSFTYPEYQKVVKKYLSNPCKLLILGDHIQNFSFVNIWHFSPPSSDTKFGPTVSSKVKQGNQIYLLTRKSSCVNARGIPTAAYQVFHQLTGVGGCEQTNKVKLLPPLVLRTRSVIKHHCFIFRL